MRSGATGEELVPGNEGTPKPLRAALIEDYQITQPSKQFIQAIAETGRGGGVVFAGAAGSAAEA